MNHGEQDLTQILRATAPGELARAAELLRRGELVVFPTETVYGVGTSPFDAAALDRLYAAKDRSMEKSIPVLLADISDLEQVVNHVPAAAQALIDRYWPGPLTIVLPKADGLPPNLSNNDGVAVRVPGLDVTRQLLRLAGGAVATTSANRSGEPPARNASEAQAALGGLVAAIVDGGRSPEDIPSTIVDGRVSPPRLLRPGPITLE
jgi:L-threonylcarbamoyladenylate synthase